jgi:hypothetical protein
MRQSGAAAYVLIGAFAVSAVLLGAFGGACHAWAVRGSPVVGGVLVAGGLLRDGAAGLSTVSPAPAVIGMPPLIVTFLTSWLTARALETTCGGASHWATVVGLACALVAVFGVSPSLLGLRAGFPVPLAVSTRP